LDNKEKGAAIVTTATRRDRRNTATIARRIKRDGGRVEPSTTTSDCAIMWAMEQRRAPIMTKATMATEERIAVAVVDGSR